jgi:orotidine-5'-phosphate decarboxylase
MPAGSPFPESRVSEHGSLSAADRLIVALDVPTIAEARTLVSELDGIASAFKIGFHLWTAHGADDLIQLILDRGNKVFLDAKMYDIENTVELAVRTAADRKISFITVHHNEKVVRAAVRGRGNSPLKILAVTLLTMFDNENVRDMGIEKTTDDIIEWNTRRAFEFGCDGVIAAPTDNLARIQKVALAQGKDFIIATPGIRPAGSGTDDHRRSGTPGQAIEAGADYLIVGRPIYKADNPAKAARSVVREIEVALHTVGRGGSP